MVCDDIGGATWIGMYVYIGNITTEFFLVSISGRLTLKSTPDDQWSRIWTMIRFLICTKHKKKGMGQQETWFIRV